MRGLQYVFSAKTRHPLGFFSGDVGRYPGAGANVRFMILGTDVGQMSLQTESFAKNEPPVLSPKASLDFTDEASLKKLLMQQEYNMFYGLDFL